jgi:hypothetical protein
VCQSAHLFFVLECLKAGAAPGSRPSYRPPYISLFCYYSVSSVGMAPFTTAHNSVAASRTNRNLYELSFCVCDVDSWGHFATQHCFPMVEEKTRGKRIAMSSIVLASLMLISEQRSVALWRETNRSPSTTFMVSRRFTL